MMFIPWIFGDEYLYLSKARNLKRGIDVLADVSQGHTYPPLYSYLLSLVMGSDPLVSYQSAILLNVAVSQLLILLSIFFLNRVFAWTKTKAGWLYVGLLYLVMATSTMITGFYFVAMSENLYTPLVILVFSLVVYLSHVYSKKQKQAWLLAGTIGCTCGLAILTRTIGVVLLPAVLMSLLFFVRPKKRAWLPILLTGVVIAVMAIGLPKLFTTWEMSRVVHDGLEQANYEELSSGYMGVVRSFLTGKGDWFVAFKIVGNHVSYLLYASFFFPLLFLIHEIVAMLKTKKVDVLTIFVLVFAMGSFAVSFLHDYLGFQQQPIRYSTYFRYFDQAVILFVLYGLIKLWQWLHQKTMPNKISLGLFAAISLVGILFLPPRDFYITLNSFGWAWLDIFLQAQWLIKVAGIGLVALTAAITWQKKLHPILLLTIVVLQVASIPIILDMHRWLSSDFQALVAPVRSLAVDDGIRDWYIVGDYQEQGLLGELYFVKYLLLFYGDAFVPVEVVSDNRAPTSGSVLISPPNSAADLTGGTIRYSSDKLDLNVIQ